MKTKTPVLLAILDGWGYGKQTDTNAIHLARKPNMDSWIKEYPFTTLTAHNGAVGLPEGQMGNSEVGHLNIGAGRVVYQDYSRINLALENGDLFKNEVLLSAFNQIKESGTALHLLGLVSDGGVHSHINHLGALVKMAADIGLEKIYIHAFMDGRDTPPQSGAGYMRDLCRILAQVGKGEVASISGRYFAMDRDNRWKRVQKAWQALVEGKGVLAVAPVTAIEEAYSRGETDEFIKPVVMQGEPGQPLAKISDNDTLLFFNFRADRARQMVHAFTDRDFKEFPTAKKPKLAECLTLTSYDKHFTLPVAFPPLALDHILGEEVSRHGMRQLRIAETEKYAHVTYFFNGGREEPFPLEDRALIPSPREVATYDLKPEMSAFKVTDELLKRLDSESYNLIVLNFANGDMVGHTGILDAAVKACEAVDTCMGKIVSHFIAQGGTVIVTADHGTAEIMWNKETNGPHTAHTCNPVPFLLIGEEHKGCTLRDGGALRDIAPTILTLLGLPIPSEMDGTSLIKEA